MAVCLSAEGHSDKVACTKNKHLLNANALRCPVHYLKALNIGAEYVGLTGLETGGTAEVPLFLMGGLLQLSE